MVGLAASPEDNEKKGLTAAKQAKAFAKIAREHGMPIDTSERPRTAATVPACRAVVAARASTPPSRCVIAFVLVAVFAQISRNWILLHAVGVQASLLDAVAVLIAVVTLSQLPVGPAVGAAAAVVILGRDGVAAAAAAGVLMTVTGTIGGLGFAGWAGADGIWVGFRHRANARSARHAAARHRSRADSRRPPRRRGGRWR